jgi:hypothetical protein
MYQPRAHLDPLRAGVDQPGAELEGRAEAAGVAALASSADRDEELRAANARVASLQRELNELRRAQRDLTASLHDLGIGYWQTL